MPPKRRHYFDTATELAKFKAALARQTSGEIGEEDEDVTDTCGSVRFGRGVH